MKDIARRLIRTWPGRIGLAFEVGVAALVAAAAVQGAHPFAGAAVIGGLAAFALLISAASRRFLGPQVLDGSPADRAVQARADLFTAMPIVFLAAMAIGLAVRLLT